MVREQPVRPVRDFAARLKQWVNGKPAPVVQSAGLYPPEQFRAALEREQARAERNGHQITLALLPANGHNSDASRTNRLPDILKSRLRTMDEAGWFDPSRIGVLMPYTSCRGAWHLIDDLCQLMQGELSASDCSVYVYPYDWIDGPGVPPEQDAADTCAAKRIGQAAEHLFSCLCHRDHHHPSNAGVYVDGAPAGLTCVYPLTPASWVEPSTWQRGLDVLCSLLGLVVFAPVFLAAAVVIKLASPGPVFFRQMRIGRGGRSFQLLKFRTMCINADTSLHQNHVAQLINGSANDGEAGPKPMTKLDNDPRVIPLGNILRGACIDELPQLINVLRGEMSLVGPRPPIPYEVHDYLPWQKRRLDAMPGLTGLWQVSGKNKLTFDDMVRLDIQYSRTRSVPMNIMIMLRTPRVIVQEIVAVWVRWKMKEPENA